MNQIKQRAIVFPASGPAFIAHNVKVDEAIIANIEKRSTTNEETWLIGSSTGALRALSIFYGESTASIADHYCDMVWYPWSTPRDLERMLKRNIECINVTRDLLKKRKLSQRSNVIPAVIISFTTWPILFVIVISLIGMLVGVRGIIYRFVEMHIYVPPWSHANLHTFPLEIPSYVQYKFKALTDANVKEVLYASIQIPVVSPKSRLGFDGGFVFGYLCGRAKENALVAIISDTKSPYQSILDPRPISPTCRIVCVAATTSSLLDWFNPVYVIWPERRKRKWRNA